jgi:hypothetical protein
MADPTLHEELAAILHSLGNAWTSTSDLADRVNVRGRYDKGDGSAMEAGQVNLRTRNGGGYDWLFERDGRLVRLRNAETNAAASGRQVVRPTKRGNATSADVAIALKALLGPGVPFAEAAARVPPRPGLYAIFAGPTAWIELGLGTPPAQRPLYVGKAEQSLLGRDVRQHFSDGKTGSSTLRRSVAALLRLVSGKGALMSLRNLEAEIRQLVVTLHDLLEAPGL